MAEMTKDINLNQVAILLSRYQFEMKGNNTQELLEQWQPLYPVRWIRLAVVEALYQGRYKVISVEHILSLWLRRGHPTFHFNHEFERMICNNMIGSVVTNSTDIAQRRQAQTALPSFYQKEQSTTFLFSSSQEIATTSDLAVEETSKELPQSEVQENELIEPENNFDLENFLADDEPTFIDNSRFDSSATQLTDVKELFAQLITKEPSSEPTISPEETPAKTERRIMSGQTIDEFKPDLDYSALYSKLKAVLQQTL
ncbi:hypothetical protein C7H19_13885 [Aphanothece hegewaldii CCALA 016]|uniref:DnaD domain-containing protein n=1 Tax=Aphanothece hegewaldii CCALA 016 TaxID=2107694 RepID=A0A2T1LWK9_9CHRO|nr:hypothetical protein [Aphanothece hegewaldii]PSF36292.1 hypothetical protein C7H19_13885 [Aphanothece hegewaldii CCALA 016]